MITERELLLDVIRFAPENSIWNISEDSWEEIPNVLYKIKLSNLAYEWEIKISNNYRDQLLELIDKYELCEKITHQKIISDKDVVFKSYDCMEYSYMKSNFPHFEDLIEKYKELGLMELR